MRFPLYARILGLVEPWQVRDVQLDVKGEEVRVTVAPKLHATFACPECDKPCPGYDSRPRSWRHLDTCQFKTILVADVPRVNCQEHGIKQAARSRLKLLQPFQKLAGTVRGHLEGILAYVATGLSNGRTEGLYGKVRTITRRSCGFHSAQSLISLIFLCCSGINLQPVHR